MQSEPRFMRVGAARVRFQLVGETGPPLLLLHGIGRSLDDWTLIVPVLAAHHRVFAVDLLGSGESDAPPLDYSFELLATFARDFLDAVGVARAILVGHSLGGGVALELALRWPERAAGLVLIASAGFGGEVSPGLRLLALPWLGERLTAPGRAGVQQTLRLLVHEPEVLAPAWLAHEYRRGERPEAQAAFLRVVRALLGPRGTADAWVHHIPARLRGLTIPALVIWGTRDKVLPIHHLSLALKHIPHAWGVSIANCGHTPQLERPPLVAALILRWLSGGAGGACRHR